MTAPRLLIFPLDLDDADPVIRVATALGIEVILAEHGITAVFAPHHGVWRHLRTRLADLPRVTFHPLGLFDHPTTLNFDASGGSASRISDSGSDTIEVARLDDAVDSPVSFIKHDLEGAELAALQGAQKHIRADHPKLAIAVYHSPSDIWKSPCSYWRCATITASIFAITLKARPKRSCSSSPAKPLI